MYRCFGCDTPPTLGHVSGCIVAANSSEAAERLAAQQDPWGWEDSPRKLDIQSGTHINTHQQEALAA